MVGDLRDVGPLGDVSLKAAEGVVDLSALLVLRRHLVEHLFGIPLEALQHVIAYDINNGCRLIRGLSL